MSLTKQQYDSYLDEKTGITRPVWQFTLASSQGLIVKLLSYGASISSIEFPDKYGVSDNVVLGFDAIEGYLKHSFIGSTVGRFANRIKRGRFTLRDQEYQLVVNNNDNHLHGGSDGWDKHVWDFAVEGNTVVFSHFSPDGDQGYPGAVMAQVSYSLSEDGCLHIDYQAISTKATPINMTNHAFFNLAGHGSGQKGLLEHRFTVNADRYLPVTPDLIPEGVAKSVRDSAFDMIEGKPLDKILNSLPDDGFDHCFCIKDKVRGKLEQAARFHHPPSGRCLEVFTTEPGVQIYTGNFLPKEDGKMVGRGGMSYKYQGAFCCESENYPDAINNENFPDCVLIPGDIYKHSIIYKFSTIM